MTESVPRNAPCPCGSGKKYKQCHLGKTVEVKSPKVMLPIILASVAIVLGVYIGIASGPTLGISVGAGGLIIVSLIVLLRDPPPPGGGGDPGAINFGG